MTLSNTPATAPAADAIPASRGLITGALAFGCLSFVSAMIVHPPMPDQPAAAILRWYVTHPRAVELGEMLMALAIIGFVWCLTEIRHGAIALSPQAARAGNGMLALGVCGASLFLAGTWAPLLLAVSADRGTEAPSPSVVHLVSDLWWFHYASQDVVIGAATACLAMLIRQRLLGRPWMGWMAAASAVLAVLGGCANFYPLHHGQLNPPTILGFLGFLLLDATMIAIGFANWRSAGRPTC